MTNEKKQNEPEEKEKSNLSDSDRIKLLTVEYLKDINENPKYKEFFNQYNQASIERFKEYFAGEKASLVVNSKYYIDHVENAESRFSFLAWEKLWEIQQRKLFDMQCLWRAKQIDIPEIKITNDFNYWSHKIEECLFLSPITSGEVERYVHFLENSSYDGIFNFDHTDWQEYDDFKQHYFDSESEYVQEPPAWYEYYEAVTGLSSLYHLPNVRGEKEEKYIKIARDQRNAKEKEKNRNKPITPTDNKPDFYYYQEEELSKFINKFEEYKIQYARECREKWYDVYDDKDLEEAIETLKLADKPIHLDGKMEWHESIIAASNNYIKQKIIERFPVVYKSYLFRIQNGLAFEKERGWREGIDHVGDYFKELVLEGRELLGEPRDFNY